MPRGDDMKLADRLSKEQKQKLNKMSGKQPKKKKEEKVNWHEIMGSNRPTYKRVKGAVRQK